MHDFSHKIYCYCWKNMYFHSKMAWPPPPYSVISHNHRNWQLLNLTQNAREGWTNSDAAVLSARRKLRKPYGLASTPLVCPRVKDLICNLISIKFYGCKNELHKRVVSVLILGRSTRNYNQFTFIYLSNGSFFWNCLKLLRFSRFVSMIFRKSCFGKILVLCECLQPCIV